MNRLLNYLGYVIGLLGIVLFGLSYYFENMLILMIGVSVLLIGIFYTIAMQVMALFKKDKSIDLLEVERLGLSITTCKHCGNVNVLEDQYCIHCGEKLEREDNEI